MSSKSRLLEWGESPLTSCSPGFTSISSFRPAKLWQGISHLSGLWNLPCHPAMFLFHAFGQWHSKSLKRAPDQPPKMTSDLAFSQRPVLLPALLTPSSSQPCRILPFGTGQSSLCCLNRPYSFLPLCLASSSENQGLPLPPREIIGLLLGMFCNSDLPSSEKSSLITRHAEVFHSSKFLSVPVTHLALNK